MKKQFSYNVRSNTFPLRKSGNIDHFRSLTGNDALRNLFRINKLLKYIHIYEDVHCIIATTKENNLNPHQLGIMDLVK